MKSRAAIAAIALAWTFATPANAQRVTASAEDIAAIGDALDALATVSELTATQGNCLEQTATAIRATGVATSVECPQSRAFYTRRLVYRDYPYINIRVWHRYTPNVSETCLMRTDGGACGDEAHKLSFQGDETVAARFAAAWTVLSAARSAAAPDDPLFASAVSSAAPPDAETLRRVQVQVEAAMRANRNVEAAQRYRDALRTSPGWADGHYNLGLLYGDLELYPEAITEMRRYLYLTPNAQDARAVQDKIYEWEAAMAETSQ